MITQGPFDLTLNQTLPLNDPGATSNNPATAVQIQNASPFIVELNSGGIVLTIQSFTAQTVPTSGGGQQMSVTPLATSGPVGQSRAPASLIAVWLLAGEQSPMLDGPLTAAAIVSSLGQSGLSGASVIGYRHTLAAGGSLNPVMIGTAPWRLWNWGFAFAVTAPSTGGCTIIIGGTLGEEVVDSTWIGHSSSSNLAGLVFSTVPTIFNDTDQEVSVFIDYSAA